MPYLSSSERDDILDRITEEWRENNTTCPGCGGRGADLDDLAALPLLERAVPRGIVPGSQMIPVLPLTCHDCGTVTLLAAKRYVDFED